jgi:hypothetical protein
LTVAQNCPYCREAISQDDLLACPGCHTPHHQACWRENGGCTVFGCQYAPADEPKLTVSVPGMGGWQGPVAVGGEASVSYQISRNGQQFGPYSLDELKRYFAEGRVALTDLAWSAGMPAWVPVSQLPGIIVPGPQRPIIPHPPAYAGNVTVQHHASPQIVTKPDSYMLSAILVTLLCCLPFGIVSIVFASQVDAKFNSGDYIGAQEASNKAKSWYHTALVCGLIIIVLSILANASKQ